MVKLKELSEKYAIEINEFWKRDWSEYTLPDRSASIIDAVAVNDMDRAIAYGQVRLFPELMLFTDMEAPLRERAGAVKLLMEEAFRGIEKNNLPEAYALIKDMRFARLIANRYGFVINHNPGVLLVRQMEQSDGWRQGSEAGQSAASIPDSVSGRPAKAV